MIMSLFYGIIYVSFLEKGGKALLLGSVFPNEVPNLVFKNIMTWQV